MYKVSWIAILQKCKNAPHRPPPPIDQLNVFKWNLIYALLSTNTVLFVCFSWCCCWACNICVCHFHNNINDLWAYAELRNYGEIEFSSISRMRFWKSLFWQLQAGSYFAYFKIISKLFLNLNNVMLYSTFQVHF